MGRYFIVILLLVIFFLSGALYGMNKDSFVVKRNSENYTVSETPTTIPTIAKEEPTNAEDKDSVTIETVDKDILAVNEKAQATNKAASFLETSVQGFYEIVVQILYEIANIFF